MVFEYIIIQAGGRGMRLGYHTDNKPKALLPIDNLPMIFHLFQQYPDKKFIIIGDYQFNTLRAYLNTFAKVRFVLLKASQRGTCACISDAIRFIPDNVPFMLIWCDLLLPVGFTVEKLDNNQNHIGISKGVLCRWSYENSQFMEISSADHGVAGLFLFKNKAELINVPEHGEFVKWLQGSRLDFSEFTFTGLREFGDLSAYCAAEDKEYRCRSFNRILFHDDVVVKEPIGLKGQELADKELRWYQKARELGFQKTPEIISCSPFTMKRIRGKNIFNLALSGREKERLLCEILDVLAELHSLASDATDVFSIRECYFAKTMNRLNTVRDLIPFADREYIKINGRVCRNIFFMQSQLEEKITRLLFNTEFAFIHGDCTFSNIMAAQILDDAYEILLIDPRGYFGFTMNYGDVCYDWAKLYYSVAGNYDQFNRGNFRLIIHEDDIDLEITSQGWEPLQSCFFRAELNMNEEKIKLIHALIWLSLTTYVWEDYDSICGAFYNGLYYLEEIL